MQKANVFGHKLTKLFFTPLLRFDKMRSILLVNASEKLQKRMFVRPRSENKKAVTRQNNNNVQGGQGYDEKVTEDA